MSRNIADDLSRNIMIHVCKDGTISYRDLSKKEKVFNGRALPVFSVDTEDQAIAIQVRFCAMQYTRHPKQSDRPWYVLPGFDGELESLPAVADKFAAFYAEESERKTLRAFQAPIAKSKPKRKSRRKGLLATLLVLLGACGFGEPDTQGTPDASTLVDAAVADATPDAGPIGGLEPVPVVCVDYKRIVQHVATDNSRDETTISWAVFDTIHPGDDFLLSICTPLASPPACGGGDACSGSTAPASTSVCSIARGGGNFLDNNLVVQCGARVEHFTSGGTLTSSVVTTNIVKVWQ